MTVYKCDVCGKEMKGKSLNVITVPAYMRIGKTNDTPIHLGFHDVEMCKECREGYIRAIHSNVLSVDLSKEPWEFESETKMEVKKLWP